MARCEDYPCCGHDEGDCPEIINGKERWRCIDCGKMLPIGAESSICNKCSRELSNRWSNGDDYDYED